MGTMIVGPQPTTVVSAYLDGRATGIEVGVLRAVDQFEKAQERSRGQLQVTVEGRRY